MPFKKGKVSNPTGRPKGSANKETKVIRNFIGSYLSDNLEEFKARLSRLSDKDYASNFLALMEYAVPKLQRIEHTGDEQQGFRIEVITHSQASKQKDDKGEGKPDA